MNKQFVSSQLKSLENDCTRFKVCTKTNMYKYPLTELTTKLLVLGALLSSFGDPCQASHHDGAKCRVIISKKHKGRSLKSVHFGDTQIVTGFRLRTINQACIQLHFPKSVYCLVLPAKSCLVVWDSAYTI